MHHSSTDARHAHRHHPRLRLHGVLRGAGAARGKARRDHRGAAPRRGRTGEPGAAAYDPARLPGGAAGLAGRGIRLVRHSARVSAAARQRGCTDAGRRLNRFDDAFPGAAEPEPHGQPAAAVLRIRWTIIQRSGFPGIEHRSDRRQEGAAGASARPLAASCRGGLGISLATGRRPGHAYRRTRSGGHVSGAGGARSRAGPSDGPPA